MLKEKNNFGYASSRFALDMSGMGSADPHKNRFY